MKEKELRTLEAQLAKEHALLEQELESTGHLTVKGTAIWDPSVNTPHTESAELEGRAEENIEFEDQVAVEEPLAHRYQETLRALERIHAGTYGLCRICNEPIEFQRLYANPAATTCIAHLEES